MTDLAPVETTNFSPIGDPVIPWSRVREALMAPSPPDHPGGYFPSYIATIRPDGRVAETRVLQSIPPLDDAVTGALGRWIFARQATLGAGAPLTLMLAVEFRL